MATSLKDEESPILGIVFCEFHDQQGPRIIFQDPETGIDKLTPETFNSLTPYIIPKEELQGRLLTVNSQGVKIIGFPVYLDDPRFERNRYIFNLCFVCSPSKRTVQYEPLVKKLALYLMDLESECQFMTNDENKKKIPALLKDIRQQLNETRSCIIQVTDSTTIHLKVVRVHADPRPVGDHEVPILDERYEIKPSQWDLTTQHLLPYVDGCRHIAKIAAEAEVELGLVKACIQNMIYYRIAFLIPLFLHSNVYVTTPNLVNLSPGSKLAEDCVKAVRKEKSATGNTPSFRSVFKIFSSLRPNLTVRDVLDQLARDTSLREPLGDIDVRKLITFGLRHGLIRRLQKYPVLSIQEPSLLSSQRGVYRWFDGNHSFDEICTMTHITHKELDEKVNKHPAAFVIWK